MSERISWAARLVLLALLGVLALGAYPAPPHNSTASQTPGEKTCCRKADLLGEAVEKLKAANAKLQQENLTLKAQLAACKKQSSGESDAPSKQF
jgi:hypothetical protein